MSNRLTSLPEIEAEVWRQLGLALVDREHAWRTPVLATVDGDTADARSVVLREISAPDRHLVFYTDERAGKVSQLRHHPRGTLVMWSHPLGWQLRCRVHLDVEMSGLSVTSRWARVRLSPNAQDYLSPQAPGTPLAALHDPAAATPAEAEAPTHAAVERTHFAVIVGRVLSMDWLELHPDGHRRALFDDEGRRWLHP